MAGFSLPIRSFTRGAAGQARPSYSVPAGGKGQPYRDSWDIERAVSYGFDRSVWVMRCIMAIAENQSKLPLTLREDNWLEGKPVKNETLAMLSTNADVQGPALLWRERLTEILLLNRQGAFIEKIMSNSGDLLALRILPPGYTYPIPHPTDFVSGYEVRYPDGGIYQLAADKVLWIRKAHPTDPYRGMTPLEAAGLSVEADYYARLYNRNFLMNDGRPGGIVVIKGSMDPADQDEIRRRVSMPPGAGFSGAGRTIVISSEDGADFVDTAMSSRDAQHVETRRATKEDILLAFGVPETILGNASGRTYDNADAERDVFWQETMLPHLNLIARFLDRVITDNPRHFVSYDFAQVPVLERDRRNQRNFHLQEYQAGLITGDEYRDKAGWEPIGLTQIRVSPATIPKVDSEKPGVDLEEEALAAAQQAPVEEAPVEGEQPALEAGPTGDLEDLEQELRALEDATKTMPVPVRRLGGPRRAPRLPTRREGALWTDHTTRG